MSYIRNMKLIVNIVICVWMMFLSLPTIIYIVGDDNDVVISYNLSEEETENQVKTYEEAFKDIHLNTIQSYVIFGNLIKNKINNTSLVNINSVYKDTFSPPPELV